MFGALYFFPPKSSCFMHNFMHNIMIRLMIKHQENSLADGRMDRRIIVYKGIPDPPPFFKVTFL